MSAGSTGRVGVSQLGDGVFASRAAHAGPWPPRLKYRQDMETCTFMGLKHPEVNPLRRSTKMRKEGVDCGAVDGSLGSNTAEHRSRRGREVGRSDRKQRE